MSKPIQTQLRPLGRRTVLRFMNKVVRKRAKSGAVESSTRARLTKSDQRLILKVAGHKCHLCGKRVTTKKQFDHVKPKSLGGIDGLGNRLPICSPCNRARWNGTPEQLSEAIQLGNWLASEIRKETPLGRVVANAWGKRRKKIKSKKSFKD